MSNQVNDFSFLYTNVLNLTTEKVYVFLINLDFFDFTDFIGLLSNNEVKRADKMKTKKKKRQYIITRGMIKKLLSIIINKDPHKIEFSYNHHGKPFINEKYNGYSVEFNTSHSGVYGLIAITLDNKVGVDIQKIKPEIDFRALSNRFFSNNERNELLKLEKHEQQEAFYLGWVRKESFIKATGMGVAYGLDRFSVSLNKEDNSNIVISDYENKKWHCYDLIEIGNYKTALTTCKNNIDILISQP